MNLRQLYLTKNNCYIAGKKMAPKGVMVHSTGANNPELRRYVGPDDGLLGQNQYGNHWNTAKPSGINVCVHAFIGKLADGTIATYQTLPWDMQAWHGGSGRNGSVNGTHISFEICEDGLTDPAYFAKAYQEAVELTAHLCALYSLDPIPVGVVIGHYEGHAMGIASNHGDPGHWFPMHGKSMQWFRSDVKEAMAPAAAEGPEPEKEPEGPPVQAQEAGPHAKPASLRYDSLADVPEWARGEVRRLCEAGAITGQGSRDADGFPSDMDLSLDMLRMIVINGRARGESA